MAFSNRSRIALLALVLGGGVAFAAPVERAEEARDEARTAVPASDAEAPASRVDDAKPADPVEADALGTEGSRAEGAKAEGAKADSTKAEAGKAEATKVDPAGERLPAAAYASTDTEAPVAFPLPDAAVSPAAPVPEVPDPARALLAGDTDIGQLRQAIDLYRKGKFAEGDRLRDGFKDPAARALCEWVAIRAGTGVDFRRATAFLRDNPGWPAGPLLRRRVEERLLAEKKEPALVRAYFGASRPETAPGKFALALAFKADGLDADAADLVRDLWRSESFGRAFEAKVMEAMPGILTTIDHRTRMERALLKEDWEMAGRAAGYAGGAYASLVRARRVVEAKGPGAPSALNAVPPSLRNDSSFLFSRAQYFRRSEKFEEAARILAAAPSNPDVLVDGDEWWVERRIVARKLIDQGDAKTAYAITSGHSARSSEKRIEAEFHAGWIALRFSGDAKAAQAHFAKAAEVAESPMSVARAAYWQGRAADVLGATGQARAFYEKAAGQPIAYYGQLARAKLGQGSLDLRRAAEFDPAGHKAFEDRLFVRALKLLAAASMKELALPLYIDAAKSLATEAEVNALGDVATGLRDARALVAIGKLAVQRGLALDIHAYPTIGIPDYEAFVAVPQVERAMVFAIARQESQFDPQAQSGVGARGLMQMMPATASRTARRVSTAYEQGRLTSDPAYCARLGQAHLGELMEDWRGSYILAFASYNAGGGNVKKWIEAYGDPRKPGIDPIDWVERIPFTETRNYVQRVMENLQVYRSRLGAKAGGKSALLIGEDLARGARPAASAEAAPAAP